MGTRLLVLVLLLVPLLVFGARAWQDRASQELLLPGLDPLAVAEIELSHGEQELLLKKRVGNGPWEIRSAADAPGDAARIGALLEELATLKGRPQEAAPAQSDPGKADAIEVRLSDADGRSLGRLAFWNGRARRFADGNFLVDGTLAEDGPVLSLRQMPLLPLWASPWSSLQPPRIDSTRLAKVERITPGGLQPLDDGVTAGMALILGKLTAVQFAPAFDFNWTKARMWRLTLRDGTMIEAAETTDNEGRIFIRFDSATDKEVQAVRRFAFRTAEPLP